MFVNACVREKSRTRRLADALLEKLGGDMTELRLSCASFPAVDEKFLNVRDELIASGDFGNPMFYLARQFASAEKIVVAAPYWDLSFPAVLKQYFEHINVLGITFKYTSDGYPVGLCKAKALYYVTTAGGNFVPYDFGFGYVKALAQNFYGISKVELIKAEGLDIEGAEPEKIMEQAIGSIKA